jgi:signal transduction histidine kinase
MSERRPSTLRNVLSFSAVMVTLLAATAALSLVLATSVLQRMTVDMAKSIESVRTIEEAEVALLLHVRAADRGEKREYADQIQSLLGEAGMYMTTTQEAVVLLDAKGRVEAYFTAARQPVPDVAEVRAKESTAIDTLEGLVDLEVAESHSAREHAEYWDRVASIAGIVLGVSIVGITATLVLWLRRRVIRPLFALADTMKRFGEGERAVRADEKGPTELREMTHRFNDMADSIAVQRQAQVAFLAGVAHDLRNPLSALKLGVELLDPSEPLPPEPSLRKTLGVIKRQISHLERMVGDFLDMAKIEAGELELCVADHDIRAIVTNAVELFEPASQSRLHIKMPDDPVMISADAVRIGQAITNLVSNAIKYSPPEEPIDIAVGVFGGEVRIEVTDRGVGIPRDDHKRIFEPFRRGTNRKTIAGTGLGLYNVQRIVQAHRGRIEIDSVPAVGSTFRIWLPTFRSRSDQQSTPASTAANSSADPEPRSESSRERHS